MEELLKYLHDSFLEYEPIFIKDLNVSFMPKSTLRVRIKELTDQGFLKRHSTGIYYLTDGSSNDGNTELSISEIVEKKYLKKRSVTIGYKSFNAFLKNSEKPNTFYVVSNAASNEHRTVAIGEYTIDIKSPKTKINESNFRILQFLDMLCELKHDAVLADPQIKNDVRAYIKTIGINQYDLICYLQYYPDKIFRTLFLVDLLKMSEI